MKKLLFLLVFFCIIQDGNASHLMGGEITWRTDSLQRFIFQVKVYRDCNGIAAPGSVTLITNAPIGQVNCSMMSLTDISPVGPGCPSCSNPMNEPNAVQEGIYQSAPVTLTGIPPASGWYFEHNDCCRNAAIV